jgi:hypothetical protein
VSELVDSLCWCVHEMNTCTDMWGQVIHKVTPHIPTWDDPARQSVMTIDSLVVSFTDRQRASKLASNLVVLADPPSIQQ